MLLQNILLPLTVAPVFGPSSPGFVTYLVFVIAALVLAYLCGAIPVALIAGRLVKGIDIREHGSGNTGTTNALRVLGWGPGAVVLALDVLKGVLGCLIVLLALNLILGQIGTNASRFYWDIPLALAFIACIVGHMFSPFMRFKGGKGIATGFGSLLVVMPPVALFVLSVFLIFAFLSRIVSVGSVAAAIAVPVGVLLFYRSSISFIVFGVLAAAVVLFAHRKNIVRLIHGEEPRFSVGSSKKTAEEPKKTPEGTDEKTAEEPEKIEKKLSQGE
ncbi:MAG: glycerol-3-phosphate 1-O-acyltransferase PlsY [Coriobacteriales bacterium]|jgi:glycerol-3-phosphate acyltransferase PlsY|nr:glycerol-3-phosphate 1-O-acyltransferase PlsY [Coriobacteriales bacterium]